MKIALTMMNFMKLKFVALNISRKNYVFWILDCEIYFDAMNHRVMIKEENQVSL